jgi:uncharacterized coiled-coil protein SlyX
MTLPATCYARFSSAEQGLSGNSLERQFRLTRKFCEDETRKWLWDEDRCLADEGRSAYHQANRQEGSKLYEFEKQAEAGLFRNGHALVVEHLDRISRAGFQELYDFLNKLTAAGVTVATVDEGMIYPAFQRIDMTMVMRVLVKSELAAEESRKKANRQIELWQSKLNKVREGDRSAITKLVPEWINVDSKTREMSLDEYRIGIVREIFDLCIDGFGSPHIANLLNKRGEETWAVYSKDDPKGRYKAGDKRAGRGWSISYINRVIQNPAVMGEYQPMTRSRSAQLATITGERFLDYYPRVIDPAMFARAQAAREGRKMGGGKVWAQQVNLFSGLAFCSVCGDKMGYVGTRKAGRVVNGTNGSRKPIQYVTGEDTNYLMCNSARRNFRCTNKKRIRYERLEEAVLDNLLHLALDDTHFQIADRVTELTVQVADQQRRIDEKRERLDRLVDSFSRTGSATVERNMLALEIEVADDEKLLRSINDQRVSALGSVSPEQHRQRIAEVRTLLADNDPETRLEARRRVHQALKQVIRVSCTPEQVSTVVVANGLAAFKVSMAGELIDSFNLSNRLDLHRGLTSGELSSNRAAVSAVVGRANKAA